MLVVLDLSLCFDFPAVKESVRMRRQQCSPHPRKSVIMPAEIIWIPPLFCLACREGREESNHGAEGASVQLSDQPDRWRLPKTWRGTQFCTSLPLLKSNSTFRKVTELQEGMGVVISAKLHWLASPRSSRVTGSQGLVWTVDILLVINMAQNCPPFLLCV